MLRRSRCALIFLQIPLFLFIRPSFMGIGIGFGILLDLVLFAYTSILWDMERFERRVYIFLSRAYVFGRKMVCSQKSVRNRNFFENAGHVSFSFCQTGSAETHTKPCKTSPQGTSIKRPAIYWDHAVSWGGGVRLALAILVGLAK